MTLPGLILAVAFLENVVMINYLGICPLATATRSVARATFVALGVSVLIPIPSVMAWATYHFVLQRLNLAYLLPLVVVILLGILAPLLRRTLVELFPFQIRVVRPAARMVVVNGTVLFVVLNSATRFDSIVEVLLASVAAGLGLLIVLVPLAAVRARLRRTAVPRPLRDVPTMFVSMALFSLGFLVIERMLVERFPPLW